MSKQIQDDCFGRAGMLSDAIIKEHIVHSLGVGAADTIKKASWDGENAALAIGLTIDTTGEHIRAAKAFGIGFHSNSGTISATKLWGSQEGYKVALNLKYLTRASHSRPTLCTLRTSTVTKSLGTPTNQQGKGSSSTNQNTRHVELRNSALEHRFSSWTQDHIWDCACQLRRTQELVPGTLKQAWVPKHLVPEKKGTFPSYLLLKMTVNFSSSSLC